MCYKILAKFLARFWQDHRQSRQEIAKMCYKILAKFLARLRQESCMILERFGTCNVHNLIDKFLFKKIDKTWQESCYVQERSCQILVNYLHDSCKIM